MNKKTVMFAAGAAGVILTLSACGADSYEYQVSGDVVSQQVDYKCPKKTLSMEAVAFTTGSHKGSSNSDSGSSPKSTKTPSATSSKRGAGTGTSTPRSTTRTASPTPSPKVLGNKGVTLSSKPDKPEKLRSVPRPVVWHKGCKVDDYEIFVQAKDGTLYEQDVRKADYDNCARAGIPKGKKYKLFPLCTKG